MLYINLNLKMGEYNLNITVLNYLILKIQIVNYILTSNSIFSYIRLKFIMNRKHQ